MNKVLLIHTRYTETGGEDIAVNKEAEFLKKFYNLETVIFQNTLTPNLKDIFAFVRNNNKDSVNKVKDLIRKFEPDYVYIHNLWFKGSLGVLKYVIKNNINTTIKIHNFRYYCTQSFLTSRHLQGELMCGACGLDIENVGYFNKYFNKSILKSILAIYFGKKYFKLLNSEKIKILTLTEHHRNILLNKGINKSKIFVQPNPIPHLINFDYKSNNKLNQIVYAGRVSKEKGILELISVWNKLNTKNYKLIIIGEGPLFDELKQSLKQNDSISLTGYKDNHEVLNIINESKAVVTATKLFEGQPTLLCEASALTTLCVFPDTGGIKEYFDKNYKFSFEQYNYVDLKVKLQSIIDSDELDLIGLELRNYILKYLDETKLQSNIEKILKLNI